MDALHAWFKAQFAEKKVEPNSGLGEAITYCLKRWDRLALFLHQAGAPLDSNLVERALKKAILHRNYVHQPITETAWCNATKIAEESFISFLGSCT